MKRSLFQILRTNYPANLKTAAIWLVWTIGSVSVSIAISVAVSFAKKHYVSFAEGITHGELFAFSASLVIGSGRLILKDEDLEDFVGRQFFGLVALISVFFSEILFFLWKLDETGGVEGPFGRISIWTSAISLLFVFLVVLIDASRIPRPDVTRGATHSVEDLLKQVERELKS
jgi:hypothetical protein